MHLRGKKLAIVVTSAVLMLGGVGVAQAANSGTVSITAGVGNFTGTYTYGAYIKPSQTGINYTGKLKSTTTQLVKFQAQVHGYGYAGVSSVSNGSTSYSQNIWDGAMLSVTTSKAQVCEVKSLWADNCTTKTYNK